MYIARHFKTILSVIFKMPSEVVFTSPYRKGHQTMERLILGLASMAIMWWRQDSDSGGPVLEAVLLNGVACPGQQGKGLCSQGNRPGWLLREVSEDTRSPLHCRKQNSIVFRLGIYFFQNMFYV